MRLHKIYLVLVAIVFAAFTLVFDTFPRSRFSELEKRELTRFPDFSVVKLMDGSFTKEVSSWFSDSQPYRDRFMLLSMYIKDAITLVTSDEDVKFHAPETVKMQDDSRQKPGGPAVTADEDCDEYQNNIYANENAKIANAGIIVVGKGMKVRALMAFGGNATGGTRYADAANAYKQSFGDAVNVYCMVIPTAVEFYCPGKAKKVTRPQRPVIDNIFAHLNQGVVPVDVYSALSKHVSEDIYLRTDHHWAALGAYYAARKFAGVAGVPFKDLSHYERKVVKNYVGSMYGYSQDVALRNAPEDFVYYKPREVKYTTTYTNYTIDSNYRVIGEDRPVKGVFFQHYRDGHGGAYCTFMGGDTKIAVVKTSTHNGRRLIILKDSFGNALPGFLFFSFEEIHVIDSRYFTRNMKKYVIDNKITDILFANNIFNAYSSRIYGSYIRFLNQPDRHLEHVDAKASASPEDSIDAASESTDMKTTEPKPIEAADTLDL